MESTLNKGFSGHYSNFRKYKENGYTEGVLKSIKGIEYQTINTLDPVTKIYKINTHGNHKKNE